MPIAIPSIKAIQDPENAFPITDKIETSPFHLVQSGPNRTIMPSFASLEDERTYRKEHLALCFRILHRMGMSEGVAGHLSVRDPVDPNSFWVNPQGKSFARMKVSNLIRVSVEDGSILEGIYPVDASATSIHAPIYKLQGRGPQYPGGKVGGVESVVHVHSPHTKAFSALGRQLEMINQDVCAYEGETVLVPFGGAVFTSNEGERIGSYLGTQNKIAVLQNHGILCVGRLSIDEATWWMVNFDMCCQAQLLLDAAKRPMDKVQFVTGAELQSTKEELGSPEMAWFCLASLIEEEEWHSQGDHKN